MNWSRIAVAVLALTCFVVFACRKIEQAPSPLPLATLKIEQLKSLDAIPSEYGNLVGVTTSSAYPDWAQLWFEKPDKTIVVVKVEWFKGRIDEKVTVIPRK
jgi:hypothetical protein